MSAFITLLILFSPTSHVEKQVVETQVQQKIKYIKIPTQWVKVAKKSI